MPHQFRHCWTVVGLKSLGEEDGHTYMPCTHTGTGTGMHGCVHKQPTLSSHSELSRAPHLAGSGSERSKVSVLGVESPSCRWAELPSCRCRSTLQLGCLLSRLHTRTTPTMTPVGGKTPSERAWTRNYVRVVGPYHTT